MPFWNQKDIPSPAISTCKTTENGVIDLDYFSTLCQDIKTFLEDKTTLETEHTLLLRINYKMKLKYRSSKDFKYLEKLSKCLKILLSVDVTSHLETLIDLIPSRYAEITYLPSKHLVDYLLVRFQGISQLLSTICEYCKNAASYLYYRLKLGHQWQLAFLLYSLTSRIFYLAKYNIKNICMYYGKLKPISNKLQTTSMWLPATYELPADLKEWLNIDWSEIDLDNDTIEIIGDDTIPFFNLIDDEDDEDIRLTEEYILINDDDKVQPDVLTLRGFDVDDDVGDIIEINDSVVSEETGNKSVLTIDDEESSSSNGNSSVEIVEPVKKEYKKNSFIGKNKRNTFKNIPVFTTDRQLKSRLKHTFNNKPNFKHTKKLKGQKKNKKMKLLETKIKKESPRKIKTEIKQEAPRGIKRKIKSEPI
ncbi:unnamed protein product [Phyllotreta striolata]|uniref:Nucleolus and neural progenitor protein-like N-terminal domain-containing protein n=1 Tax=Phyllotreta striolata TaxID=444603 RepID=A0A9N9XJU7_PHYSR|nr:unnamed protein product [Phyllotreta striolata]